MLLQVCVNGNRRPSEHPALPCSPAQIAVDVAIAVSSGAGAAHVHVKDARGDDTFDATALAAVLTAVRGSTPAVPVGVTTGAWPLPDPAARVRAIRSWTVLPDFASINWHEDGADAVAGALLARGIAVEAGLWHDGGVDAWLASPHRGSCLRVLVELPDGLDEAQTQVEAHHLLERVRAGSEDLSSSAPDVLLHGEGTSCWPALRLALALGLDTRIGLEDTLWLADGSPAPANRDLVEMAAALVARRQGLRDG